MIKHRYAILGALVVAAPVTAAAIAVSTAAPAVPADASQASAVSAFSAQRPIPVRQVSVRKAPF
jgi:hypothetical protein